MTDRADRKERIGVVTSDARDRTITIQVTESKRHMRYDKVVPSRSRLHVHDENNEAKLGDIVRVAETRPLSKTKRWRLVEIVERAR
jgi:small subunit ribosomal protein S17